MKKMNLSSFLVPSQSSNEVRQFFGSVSYRLMVFYVDLKEIMKVWKSKIWVLSCLSLPNKTLIHWNNTFCNKITM